MLVTHFMEEAARLCDQVGLIDRGKVIALDRPAALGERAATSKRVRLRPPESFDDSLLRVLPEVSAVEHHGRDVVVLGSGELLTAVVLAFDHAGPRAEDIRPETASLEDAFLALTNDAGHAKDTGSTQR